MSNPKQKEFTDHIADFFTGQPQHSPGPWDSGEVPTEGRQIAWVAGSGGVIATVYSDVADGAPNHLANARIMASATELLKALESMYAVYKALSRANHTLDDSVLFDARRAIAKAKGEPPVGT